jgi:hypothetical protein
MLIIAEHRVLHNKFNNVRQALGKCPPIEYYTRAGMLSIVVGKCSCPWPDPNQISVPKTFHI